MLEICVDNNIVFLNYVKDGISDEPGSLLGIISCKQYWLKMI